jgi:hypothetical protein
LSCRDAADRRVGYNAARTQDASEKAIEDAFTEGRNVLASRSDGQVFDTYYWARRDGPNYRPTGITKACQKMPIASAAE